MHLVSFLVLVVYAVAYPLSRDLPSTRTREELREPSNPPETTLFLASTCSNGGHYVEPSGFGERVSPMLGDGLLNTLASRAVASQAPPTSTTLQVVIPLTPSRATLSPLPTSTPLPSHTQPESTAEEHSSIPAMPHAPNEASSPMATATATTTNDGDGSGSGSDSGSDPSIFTPTSTPTSTDSSNPSELATILGSVFGAVIFIGMIIAFIIMWKRN